MSERVLTVSGQCGGETTLPSKATVLKLLAQYVLTVNSACDYNDNKFNNDNKLNNDN